ncbi:MAG: helix-turn-helix transcriptional regulator, partial [Eubacteriales bacterium]|nr:helix-turn-helix transcriptional regulator [Eubacteriales bacterium]
MKTNFSSYLNLKRVETSKRLLADSSVNLLEIAGLSGFEDQSYFTKVFKKYTGTSPGKYRESMIPDT